MDEEYNKDYISICSSTHKSVFTFKSEKIQNNIQEKKINFEDEEEINEGIINSIKTIFKIIFESGNIESEAYYLNLKERCKFFDKK